MEECLRCPMAANEKPELTGYDNKMESYNDAMVNTPVKGRCTARTESRIPSTRKTH